MSSEGFREQLNAAASRSHVVIPRLEKVVQLLQYDIAAEASCLSVFSGSTKGETLVITSLATHSLRIGLIGAKQLWSVDHDDLQTASTGRRTFNGYVVDSLLLTSTNGRERDFQFRILRPETTI